MEAIMEKTTDGSILAVFLVLLVMGYALLFCFLNTSLLRREIKYLRQDAERNLKYHKEQVERELEYLKIGWTRER